MNSSRRAAVVPLVDCDVWIKTTEKLTNQIHAAIITAYSNHAIAVSDVGTSIPRAEFQVMAAATSTNHEINTTLIIRTPELPLP